MSTSVPIPAEAPLHVDALRILGTSITRESFLNSVVKDVFNAQTSGDVLASVKEAAAKLQRHDIFEEIKVYMDSSRPNADSVHVTFDLKEKSKGVYQTTLAVGENEANMTGAVTIRNIFGGAETATTRFAFGNRTKAAVEIVAGTPLQGSPDVKLEAFANGSIRDYSMINNYEERANSVGARVKGTSCYGNHQVAYAMTRRDITAQPKSSGTVRANSGENLKSALTHTFVSDTRDHVTMPTKGKYLAVTQEIAGMGQRGDANYFKNELAAQVHQPVMGDIVLSTGVKFGLLMPTTDNERVNVSDRFYVGGPLSVRGFKMGGIGPRDGNDALGGNVYYAAGASLTAPIPGAAHLPVRAHAFFNAGNIASKAKDAPLKGTLEELINESRTAAGFGLIFHHELARVEANFCIPLRFKGSDLPKHGFQLGLGINFL
ncbi:surface antigen-domain-containing protein [Zychaea mexicana]|uniref:surface antigen-domain-containing protein n=1 Tax=Zychaea mexicana TaxID=64656 RepID=UPI0022FEEBEB|nr:surface antigen-domain-containing protein [Zychaea mexicana]KAI9494365.1 surface antigen-domain-containing protein [Zychaea mexicana]